MEFSKIIIMEKEEGEDKYLPSAKKSFCRWLDYKL